MPSSTTSYFRSGTYVRLENDETPMLVTNDNGDGSVICFWFCPTEDKLVWRRFDCSQLRAAYPAVGGEGLAVLRASAVSRQDAA